MESGRGSEEEKTLVETFCGITSASKEEGEFFLESHNWLLDAAIHSFYENSNNNIINEAEGGGGEEEEEAIAAASAPRIPLPSSSSPALHPSPSPPPFSIRHSTAAMASKDKKPSSKPSGSRPGIRTLSDLNRHSGSGSDSDSDGPPEYYTGGEKSGMLVQDPSKGNHDVDSIFDQAQQMAALQEPLEHHHPSSSSRSFTGTGRLLSGETVPSASAPQQPENIVHNINLWSNGFTVNDGPLRRFDDPANASFLESIKKSLCPRELAPADPRSPVHCNLTRRDEKFPEPVKRRSPFQGIGRTLGSGSTDPPVSEPAAPAAAPSTVSSPSVGLSVDDSLPSTSIQLRLADGTRMVARFNYHHTVGDIRAFIDASRPGAGRTYQLQTVDFPPKQLIDVTKTIEQTGLANSVVIQKL